MNGSADRPSAVALVVAGMHRSGTSATTSALAQMGFVLGSELIPSSSDNPNGFWENKHFVELHDRLLSELGLSWDDPRQLPADWLESDLFSSALLEIQELISSEFGGSANWAVKDPRLCRLLPLWKKALKASDVRGTYLLVVRHPLEVSASIGARNGWGTRFGELLWLRYVFDSVRETSDQPRAIVAYEDLLREPNFVLGRALGELGFDAEAMMRGVDLDAHFSERDRHHFHGSIDAEATVFTSLACDTYEILQTISSGAGDWKNLVRAMDDFEVLWQAHAYLLEEVMPHAQHLRRRDQLAHLEIERISREGAEKDAMIENANSRLEEEIVARERSLAAMDDRIAAVESVLSVSSSRADRLADELESLRAETSDGMHRKDAELVELRRVLDELRGGVIDASNQTNTLGESVEAIRRVLIEMGSRNDEAESERRRIADGLQVQINLLRGAQEEFLRHPRWGRRLQAFVGRAARRSAWILARLARDIYLRLPGTETQKKNRSFRLTNFRSALLSASNGSAISKDIDLLAADRWSDTPAFLPGRGSMAGVISIDVSVVLYNSGRWIDGFVTSLSHLFHPAVKLRLLVRDHGQGDVDRKLLEEAIDQRIGKRLDWVYTCGANKGFGAGHNHNFALSASEFFLACNIDGRFHEKTLSALLDSVISSDARVVGWELRQTPYEHPKYYDPVTMKTSWVSGACVLFRSSAYRAVGGFDESIFMYGEDVDLSYRLRSKGWDLLYVPRAVFQHDTYAEANEFKPLQFHGSTLANALMRLRFGTVADILAIPLMWTRLAHTAKQLGVVQGWRAQTRQLIMKTPRFLLSRLTMKGINFPVAEWDYGIRREGAFEAQTADLEQPALVSIIVRTYRGRERLLKQALLSIAMQTYEKIEVVVVEDKGDTMKNLVEQWSSEFGLATRYFHCDEPGSNRCRTGNIGLEKAGGEYCCFLDDDDLLFSDHVEYLAKKIEGRPDLGACYALSWETKIEKADDGTYREVVHSMLPNQRTIFDRDRMQRENYIPIQCVLFRRSLYEMYGGFNEKLENLEDWNLWRRYSWRHDFMMCPKITSIYHVPNAIDESEARQALLNQYYAAAKAESDNACSLIDALGADTQLAAGGSTMNSVK